MTANAVRGDRERCLLAGMDDYLAKPVTLEQLELMLQRWLSRAESSCVSAPPPATTAGVARSPFDARVLAELRALYGSDEEVAELLADYLTQAGVAQDAQHAALAARDLAAVAFEAHRMKSSSRFLGARRAARLYALLEGYGKKGMPERVTATAARLARELHLVERALTARVLPRSRGRSVAAGDPARDGPITTCAEP
jgi:HPt (histidine-containing phosphotransfer) domain-containing protein